ncbi:hypothetical protein Dimus_028242 [Dionaea muscipula]
MENLEGEKREVEELSHDNRTYPPELDQQLSMAPLPRPRRRRRICTRRCTKAKKTTLRAKHRGGCRVLFSIESLPIHVTVEILARVSSSSFTDLYNSKLCCKEFLKATEEDYVLQHTSIPRDRFPVVPWTKEDKLVTFLKRCRECGNAEALYREGMVDYFSRMRIEAGLENLKRAANKGHIEASYVYGIILVCTERKSAQGRKLLDDVLSNSAFNIECLRERIKTVVRQMWVTNSMAGSESEEGEEAHVNSCTCSCQQSEANRGWPLDDEDDVSRHSQSCNWDCEIRSFRAMLRQYCCPIKPLHS